MKSRLFAVIALLALSLSLSVFSVFAHEGRVVGDYSLEFGWRNEPAYAGLFNGPEIYISLNHGHAEGESDEHADAFPEDIAVSLQAEVTFGPETVTIPLEASWGETGYYIVDLIPSLPGDYSFRIFGTIGETAVDETFTSLDGEFSSVLPSSDIVFPAAGNADVAALLARIETLEARLEALENE